jgi:peptide/nickel transport system substrate-binding protein
MKRRDFLTGAAAIGAAGVVGLQAPAVRAQGARVLKFAPHADLAVLDPIYTTAFVTRNHALMVFDTLYGVDENLKAQPQMVEGHNVENDGKTWRLSLREGLRFHDNEPVLARDVVASLKRWGSRDAYAISLMDRVDEISAVADKVVQIRLKHPFPILPEVLGKPGSSVAAIMPERLANTEGTKQITEMIGSGPFRFKASERVPGALAVYEKFAGYVPRPGAPASFMAGGKVANFDRVEWHTLPDPSTASAALQQGEIDWWEFPTADLIPLLKKHKDITIEIQDPSGMPCVLRFNHLQPPFDNPAIRRALIGAINQRDFMFATGGDDPAMWNDRCGFFHPKSPMATDVGMEAFSAKPDYAKVKKALADAGYKGERVVMMTAADHSIVNPLNQVAADALQQCGINLDLQTMDWGTTFQRLISNKPLAEGGWSVHANYTSGFGTMNPAAHTYLRGSGRKALFGWPDSPKIEEMRNAWLDATSEDEQKRICRDLQVQAFQDVPYIPLGVFYQPTAYRKSLQGMMRGLPLFYGVRKA